jgi:hypothetical protein
MEYDLSNSRGKRVKIFFSGYVDCLQNRSYYVRQAAAGSWITVRTHDEKLYDTFCGNAPWGSSRCG